VADFVVEYPADFTSESVADLPRNQHSMVSSDHFLLKGAMLTTSLAGLPESPSAISMSFMTWMTPGSSERPRFALCAWLALDLASAAAQRGSPRLRARLASGQAGERARLLDLN
jgi:hypothetical protein